MLQEKIGADVPPVEVTPFDVQKYRDHLVELGRKPATVNRRLAGLRTFFDWAVKEGEAASNPAADVNGVEQSRRVPRSRVSEVAALQLRDVALGERSGKVIVRAARNPDADPGIWGIGRGVETGFRGDAPRVTTYFCHAVAARGQGRLGDGGGADGARERVHNGDLSLILWLKDKEYSAQ